MMMLIPDLLITKTLRLEAISAQLHVINKIQFLKGHLYWCNRDIDT